MCGVEGGVSEFGKCTIKEKPPLFLAHISLFLGWGGMSFLMELCFLFLFFFSSLCNYTLLLAPEVSSLSSSLSFCLSLSLLLFFLFRNHGIWMKGFEMDRFSILVTVRSEFYSQYYSSKREREKHQTLPK